MTCKTKFFIFILIFNLLTTSLFAYEDSTHKSITENAISTSGIATYLENIGIKNTDAFTSDKFPNANLWCLNPYENTATGNFTDLIVEGNRREDCPVYRSGNHFYDPTTGSKLTDGTNTKYSLWSALERVTGSGNSIDWLNSGPYKLSWIDARDYYYSALTLTNKDDRNKNWGNLFLSIGNILHLIQDMASPAHVRNDSHGPGDNPDMYEDWSSDYTVTSNYSSVNLPKLTDYWDAENGKGLAEFTNSNFFSRDTNVDNTEHQPQYSKPTVLLNGQEYQEVVTDADGNSETVIVKYGLGTVVDSYTNTAYSDTRLTAYSLWDFDYRKKENGWVYSLNDTVHQTYADYLIPRAVGYSAGLLNYFFRGKIDMVKESSNSNQYIIKNLSNENMFGTFSLYYDDANDNRYLAASWRNFAINANSQSSSVTFTAPSSPAPKEKGRYILVFQGTFGNEIGAVMGKVVEGLCAGQWVEVGACSSIYLNVLGNQCSSASITIKDKFKDACYYYFPVYCWEDNDKCVDVDGVCRTRAWCEERGLWKEGWGDGCPLGQECCMCNDYRCSQGTLSSITQSPCYNPPSGCMTGSARQYEWKCP